MATKLKIRVNGLVHDVSASSDTPLLYVLVSLTVTSLPLSAASTMSAVTLARSRVSLKMVEYCSPRSIDLIDGTSASWPLTMGIAMLPLP